MLQWNVVWAVLRRNVESYFSGALGYLVVVLFVTVGAFCAFGPQFFGNNLANLDQLSTLFPTLLLLVVPAITMASWADERKLGTDEILFTLPASDIEILIGKYVAALAVYTIALLFSITQLFVLAWIGDPDWGVVFTTYVGFWFAGAALISVGMFASVLTNSTTVAYVLGAALCAIPVAIGAVAPGSPLFQTISLSTQLHDFTVGLIPLSGLLYFTALIAFMLYLNLIFISHRHWQGNEEAAMGAHFSARAVALAIALLSVNYMANETSAYFVARLDATAESIYTLTPTTRETIRKATENKRNVTIQAFMSEDVPQRFVHVRKQFDGLLRQYDRIGGSTVDVRIVSVGPKSTKAKREARTLGINPQSETSEVNGKTVEQDVFMGAVITSNLGEVVLDFLDENTSLEYELTRSIATVISRQQRRLKVGVLETDSLRIGDSRLGSGGQDERMIQRSVALLRQFHERTLEALETQYDVESISRSDLSSFVRAAEDEKQKAKDLAKDFEKLDKNSNDKLTEKEFVAKKEGKEAKDAKKEFKNKDQNDDKSLSLKEFQDEQSAEFKSLDEDGDKKLTKDEYVADAEDDDAADKRKEFKSKDTDKNGSLSIEEFKSDDGNQPDVLLVVQPSSLPSSAMSDLNDYIKAGNGTLLLDDPLPFYPYVAIQPADIGVTNAPVQARPNPQSGLAWLVTNVDQEPVDPKHTMAIRQMHQQAGQMPPQFVQMQMENYYRENPDARPRYQAKADGGSAESLMKTLGIEWNPGQIVWDIKNPHPSFIPAVNEFLADKWPQRLYGPEQNAILFATDDESGMNKSDPISAGLREVMFIYPGAVAKKKGAKTTFTPLIRAAQDCGFLGWDDFTHTPITEGRAGGGMFGAQGPTIKQRQQSGATGLPLRLMEERPTQYTDAEKFKLLDENKDKIVTQKELVDYRDDIKLNRIRKELRELVIERLDVNKDDELTEREFSVSNEPANVAVKDEIQGFLHEVTFGDLDRDSDGRIDIDDLMAKRIGRDKEAAREMFKKFNSKKPKKGSDEIDGLTIDEFRQSNVIAAHITSEETDDKAALNVVFVADQDFITQFYFEQEANLERPADNLNFLFNAIESLSGDDSFVQLRNRRAKPRPLIAIQTTVDKFRRDRTDEQRKAEVNVKERMDEAQARLDDATTKIDESEDLSFLQKQEQSFMAVSNEQRRFNKEKRDLALQLENKIDDLEATEQEKVDALETWYRTWAVILPPFPALLLGIIVLFIRISNEQSNVVESRRRED